jgi:hypothetical protein
MPESNQTELLLTEIRDLLAAREERYSEYLSRVEEINKSNSAERQSMRRAMNRDRIGLFLVALIIGIFLWAFTLYVTIRVS